MSDSCAKFLAPNVTVLTPSSTGGKLPMSWYSLIVAVTDTSLPLYTPRFVRKVPVDEPPLERLVNNVPLLAAVGGRRGMNIPTDPTVPWGQGGTDAGEYRREVTTRPLESGSNSTAPSELGALKR